MYILGHLLIVCIVSVDSFPDPGQWSASYTKAPFAPFGVAKPLYSGSGIYVSVNCEPSVRHQKVELQWVLRQTSCFEEGLASDIYNPQILHEYFLCPMSTNSSPQIRYFRSKPILIECSNRIHLEFTNASFITFSDKIEIPYLCQNAVNNLPTPKYEKNYSDFNEVSLKKNETNIRERRSSNNTTNPTSDVTVLEDSDKTTVPSKVPVDKEDSNSKRTESKIPESINENKPFQEKEDKPSVKDNIIAKDKNIIKDGVIVKNENSVKGTVTVKNMNIVKDNMIVKSKDIVREKEDEQIFASAIKANYSFFGQNYGYVSGPFSSPINVKLGSKLTTVDMDGIYLFILSVKSVDQASFNISVDIAMKGDHGYLSAIDYPLLLFYGVMCGLYVIYAVAWLVMSALQWRDLLRIQFWIGAVILLGLMEKAVFYAEYQSINYTGQSVQGAILFAEILSCMKRTLARMLIIIVSLGFGIVKPRLGPMLHRIIGVGALYFCLGTIEGGLRVLKPKTDPGNQALMAGIPLAVTDSVICWWIFSSLAQTIRTLRLRRNIVKLQLYRHFTNTLLLSVVGSVGFMTWSIHAHKLVNCIADWKELWVDEAYWHFLFSTILFVIMILWRPTNNNQRYAFTPLLDAMDDEEEEDEENHLTNDAFDGMKMRTTKNNFHVSPKLEDKPKQDDDLKWAEENIPASLTDVALPSLMDSDEELMTAKFERSKME